MGDEALEYIRAAYSGHRCLATTHAESGLDALDRMLSLARPAAAGDSEFSLRSMLAKGVDTILYLKNFRLIEILTVQSNLTGEGHYVMEKIWQNPSATHGNPSADEPFESLVPGSREFALRI